MVLFCGGKILRESGSISATEISIGKRIDLECFKIYFNDNTEIILPKNTKIHLVNDKKLEINRTDLKLHFGSKSKYKIEKYIQTFTNSFNDPYIVGLAICTPVRNNALHTKKAHLFDKSKLENTYYTFDLKPMYGNSYQIVPENEYPNLLRVDMKKIKNFGKMSQRFIPDEFLYSNIESRQSLLRGCMDMMGRHYRKETTFESCSEQLSKDVSFLVRSLGGFAKTRCKQGISPYYITSISFDSDFNPFNFKSEDFLQSLKPRHKSIDKIESLGIMPCLEVPLDSVVLDSFVKIS